MAKLTVYIPDDLLDRARALNPGANTSQLVQHGLERLVPAEDAAYARRPGDAEALLASAADQLREGAAREYERGYRAALSTVSKAGERLWRGLDSLARKQFDLVQWARSCREGLGMQAAGLVPGVKAGFDPPEWFGPLADDLGDLLDPIGWDNWSFTPTGLFVRGYQAALRDVWEAVERPTGRLAEDTPAAAMSEEAAEPST
jgi:post-segregation antitoxin (ccd killing protein)